MHSPDDIDQTLTRSWLTEARYSPLLSQHTDCTSVLWPLDYKWSTSVSHHRKKIGASLLQNRGGEKLNSVMPTVCRGLWDVHVQGSSEGKCSKGTFWTKERDDMLVFKNKTCRVYFFPCVSISNMETTFSAAAAKYCPALGWNRTWAVPPCTRQSDKPVSY